MVNKFNKISDGTFDRNQAAGYISIFNNGDFGLELSVASNKFYILFFKDDVE